MITTKTSELANALCRGRNADGGWGYYPGKVSRIEPTCWTALYLFRATDSQSGLTTGLARWLASRRCEGGSVDDATGQSPNVGFSALAAMVARNTGILPADRNRRLIDALCRTNSAASEATATQRHNTVQGWSWLEDRF